MLTGALDSESRCDGFWRAGALRCAAATVALSSSSRDASSGELATRQGIKRGVGAGWSAATDTALRALTR